METLVSGAEDPLDGDSGQSGSQIPLSACQPLS
jgi:hypothetical protein